MQFSELSELTNIIVLMRSGATGGSPRFHDRHDSEIDKMYNNSPPDDDSNQINIEDPVTVIPAPPPPPEKAGQNGEGETQRRPADNQPTVRNKGGTKIVVFDKNVTAKKDHSSEYSFVREDVPASPAKSSTGELSRLLKKGRVVTGTPTPHDADMPMINLTIYLPDRSKMSVEVYEIVTVEEAIEAILRVAKAEKKAKNLYFGHPECYELRLHEGDGFPDDDFPVRVSNEEKNPLPQMRSSRNLAMTKRSGTMGGTYLLKIILPNDNYTVLPVNMMTTAKELMPILSRKQNFRSFTTEYVFHLTDDDKERLKRTTSELEMEANIMHLGLEELKLAPKTYADTPQVDKDRQNDHQTTTNVETTLDVDQFMFNEVTGARYQEWTVVKTNKYGIRQSRIMGIDSTRIYSKRPINDKAMKRMGSVKRSERLMADVIDIKTLDSMQPQGCCFRITFKETSDGSVVVYEAASVQERAEILAKVKYNMQRFASKSK